MDRESAPQMFYFGPWSQAGHHMRSDVHPPANLEASRAVSNFTRTNPWGYGVDGGLCPQIKTEGRALVHHLRGWTALSFWDYTVDTRPGSHSTYLAEGTFTFQQMVEMAKARFSERWAKMAFSVTLVG